MIVIILGKCEFTAFLPWPSQHHGDGAEVPGHIIAALIHLLYSAPQYPAILPGVTLHPPPTLTCSSSHQPPARGLHQAVDNDKTMGVKFCSRGDCVKLCRDHCGHKSWDRLPNYNGWSHTREVVTRAVNEIWGHFSQCKEKT